MTASQRIGDRLPELLEELGAPRVPDYYDDLLRTTAATRQRPGWASLERWLPVASISRPAPFGLPSWQPLVLLVGLLLAAAVGAALIVGARPKLPAPFGPAANGVLLASSLDGSLVAIDPATATASGFGATPNRYYPAHSPDGQRMIYVAKNTGTDPKTGNPLQTLFVAKADGSGAVPLLSDASQVSWVEWSPTSDALLVLTDPAVGQDAWLFDVRSTSERVIDFRPLEVREARFRPDGELVFLGHDVARDTWAFYVTPLSDVRPRPLTTEFDREPWGSALSPDGSTLAYATNLEQPGRSGQVHLVDVPTGVDTPMDLPGAPLGVADTDPLFSPDGRWLLVNRFDAASPYGRTVLVRADGSGEAISLQGRPAVDADQTPERVFSPDGTLLVLRYAEDQSVWIYDTATGVGRQVEGIKAEGLSWQRR